MFRCVFIALPAYWHSLPPGHGSIYTHRHIFASQSDVGDVLHPGSAEYDANTKTYTVSGSGDNMWASNDEFHFVWKQVSAKDLSLTADISSLGDSKEGHRKAVLMIRQSLDGDSAYVDAARHGEGSSPRYNSAIKRAPSRAKWSRTCPVPRVCASRSLATGFTCGSATRRVTCSSPAVPRTLTFQAPFYVGIGVCAHQKDAVEKATFSNVVLDTNITPAKAQYSTVENSLALGDARTGFVSPKHLTAPGWSPDGKTDVRELAAIAKKRSLRR